MSHDNMDEELAAAFAAAFPVDNGTTTSGASSSTRISPSRQAPSSSAGLSPREARDSAQAFAAISKKILKDASREINSRKRRRHNRKTTCAQCGKKAEKGTKLSMCSRCK
jgi:hypothetical protein